MVTTTTQEQQTAAALAYTQTQELLQQPATFLAPIASVVSLKNVIQEPPLGDDAVATSLLTPNRGHHALFRALEQLEGLEKQEAELQLQNSTLTPQLTSVVTGDDYTSARHAVDTLEALCQSVPRRVCQHPVRQMKLVCCVIIVSNNLITTDMMLPFIMHKLVDVVIVEIQMRGHQMDFVLIMDQRILLVWARWRQV
jgi:hypothetical protein